jgi:hypothetical protein
MNKVILICAVALSGAACTTMNDSLKLGMGMGAGGGAAATYAAHESVGHRPTLENVAAGAGIGMVLGLITSHMVHQTVVEERQAYQGEQIEMHFGDLPPSPFIMPAPSKKGGK